MWPPIPWRGTHTSDDSLLRNLRGCDKTMWKELAGMNRPNMHTQPLTLPTRSSLSPCTTSSDVLPTIYAFHTISPKQILSGYRPSVKISNYRRTDTLLSYLLHGPLVPFIEQAPDPSAAVASEAPFFFFILTRWAVHETAPPREARVLYSVKFDEFPGCGLSYQCHLAAQREAPFLPIQ